MRRSRLPFAIHFATRFAALSAAFSALALAVSVSASASPALSLAHNFAPGSLPDRTAAKFAEFTKSAADKPQQALRIVIQRGPSGEEGDNLARLRRGQIDCVLSDLAVFSDAGSDRYRILGLPFLYSGPEHALSILDGPLGEHVLQHLRDEGLELLSWHYLGPRMLTANAPIHSLRELHGLRLRLPQDDTVSAAWLALGAHPRQIPITELPTALRRGQVDAQENPPALIRSERLYEHQKYLMRTNHQPQPQLLLCADRAWKKLSADVHRQLRRAAREASAWATRQALAEQEADVRWLVEEGGMTLIDFNPRGVERALSGLARLLAGNEGELVYRQVRELR